MGERVRAHRLCKKWPPLAMLLSMILVFIVAQFVPILLMAISQSVVSLATAAIALVAVLVIRNPRTRQEIASIWDDKWNLRDAKAGVLQ